MPVTSKRRLKCWAPSVLLPSDWKAGQPHRSGPAPGWTDPWKAGLWTPELTDASTATLLSVFISDTSPSANLVTHQLDAFSEKTTCYQILLRCSVQSIVFSKGMAGVMLYILRPSSLLPQTLLCGDVMAKGLPCSNGNVALLIYVTQIFT